MYRLLWKLDRAYFRVRDAWRVLTKNGYIDEIRNDGFTWGRWTTERKVLQKLNEHDPNQFENQHFKLGYYYASESVKVVLKHDEDNAMA
jgi:hypothetical protein